MTVSIKNFQPDGVSIIDDPSDWFEHVFVYFLQGWFGHENFVGTGMHWIGKDESSDDSDETTEMVITATKPSQEEVYKIPHVVVVLGGIDWAGLATDQMQSTSTKTGGRQHSDLMPSSVTIHCQAKNGVLARRMAWWSSFGLVALRRLIMRAGKIHELQVRQSISGETPPGALSGASVDTDVVSCVVSVPFYWQSQWRITRSAPVLRGIRTNLMSSERKTLQGTEPSPLSQTVEMSKK